LCQEPLINNLWQNNRWDAYKISDFVTAEELRRNEAFYEMIYGGNDVYDGITISLHDSPQQPDLRELSFRENYTNNLKRFPWDRHLWQTQETLENLFFVLVRSQENFTERDRAILNLFRPHLLVAYHNVLRYSALQKQLNQLTQVSEHFGTIFLSADGYIEHISDRAVTILQCHFATEWIGTIQLPDTLHSWVQQQMQHFNAAQASQLLKPLPIQAQGKQLSIRLLKDASGKKWILTLEESHHEPLSINSFCSIGLTKRESEVMFGIVQGFSNAQIATQLCCSDKTVKKHLEHIYSKLNVQSRSMAVTIALDFLQNSASTSI
jgi:DNA-binding CsgD family transcriptional regulator